MKPDRLTIFFSGMIAGDPGQGGATWAVLQYLLGLRRLGHDVFFIEPLKPASIQPAGAELRACRNASYFRRMMAQFGLQDRSALLCDGQTVGLPYSDLLAAAKDADLLINVSGMLTDEGILEAIPRRLYLDLDPAFVQMWHAVQGIDMRFDAHTHFATVGLNLGDPDCLVPTCGRRWIKTFQPVVLDEWSACGPSQPVLHDGLTTIANWRGYGSIEHEGILYGQKAHSFRQLIDLPRRTTTAFLPALAIHPAETRDVEALVSNGWRWTDPAVLCGNPDDYRRFIQGSWAEIGIAKTGYVASRCGWFSDRSACYLASGRPVLAQQTGFARHLPTGSGLIRFDGAEQVLAGIESLHTDYGRHCRAAREIAREHFDSGRVLGRLIDLVAGGK